VAALGPDASAFASVSTATVRDAEVVSVGPTEIVVTCVTDPGVSVATLIGEHEIVTPGPYHVARAEGLAPDTDYAIAVEGHPGGDPHLPSIVRTLPVPSGRLRAKVATVNDVHFGETECGRIDGLMAEELGPIVRAEPGEPPYPQTMNGAAIAEIGALQPDAIVVKGDLTCLGTHDEYEQFLAAYGSLGPTMRHVRGNHDAMRDPTMAVEGAPFAIELDGVTLVVLDTVQPGTERGQLTDEQTSFLTDVAGSTSDPVLAFGHHHIWNLDADRRSSQYFGINPDDSEKLADVVAAHENIAGYFAGHTHRHRIRRFARMRDVPCVEIGCTKDYPGTWAEYRIYDGGYVQTVHRMATPAALSWSERTRPMFGGLYRDYALGGLDERCFTYAF
jgi:predicted phosphodiesterase